MSITRTEAELALSQMKAIIAANHNYSLIRKSYADGLKEGIKSLERRIVRKDFDAEVAQ